MSEEHFYTRDELVAICERAIVAEDAWRDRDSAGAQMQIGQAWALLAAGCEFDIESADDETIWIEVHPRGFMTFECGVEDAGTADWQTFYLPTPQRLDAAAGTDWY